MAAVERQHGRSRPGDLGSLASNDKTLDRPLSRDSLTAAMPGWLAPGTIRHRCELAGEPQKAGIRNPPGPPQNEGAGVIGRQFVQAIDHGPVP